MQKKFEYLKPTQFYLITQFQNDQILDMNSQAKFRIKFFHKFKGYKVHPATLNLS